MEHWLFSVLLRSPPNTHLYGYLMGRQEAIEAGCGRMNVICEKVCRTNNIQMLPADVLVSMLDPNGVKLVREVVSASRRCKESLATATDFHISAWVMPDEDPRAAALLALHADDACPASWTGAS
jgi:hypothetical protein